jgi:cytochrome b involved in lipid metabolism
MMSRNS